MKYINFLSPFAWRPHMKFNSNWLSSFREVLWKCWRRTPDDGGYHPICREAKNMHRHSLELPDWSDSKEGPQHMFLRRPHDYHWITPLSVVWIWWLMIQATTVHISIINLLGENGPSRWLKRYSSTNQIVDMINFNQSDCWYDIPQPIRMQQYTVTAIIIHIKKCKFMDLIP